MRARARTEDAEAEAKRSGIDELRTQRRRDDDDDPLSGPVNRDVCLVRRRRRRRGLRARANARYLSADTPPVVFLFRGQNGRRSIARLFTADALETRAHRILSGARKSRGWKRHVRVRFQKTDRILFSCLHVDIINITRATVHTRFSANAFPPGHNKC